MRNEQAPGWVSACQRFPPSASEHLTAPPEELLHFAGTSHDGQLCWVAHGPALEVFHTTTACKVAAWHFGAITKDEGCDIDVITEYKLGSSTALLIGICTGTANGVLCLFDVSASKVIKAISVPYRITGIEVLSRAQTEPVNAILSSQFQCFHGVVAVGTTQGRVFIIDLCTDDIASSDEVCPDEIAVISQNEPDWPAARNHHLHHNKHLCLELDKSAKTRGYFYFHKPKKSGGAVIKTWVADEVSVSALKFVKQAVSLVIGFNFGSFQIWRMSNLVLQYTSKFEEESFAVTHIAYQEPENDPRNFCYLWIAKGPTLADQGNDFVTDITMFQVCYDKRSWVDGFGYLYDDLNCIGPRLEHTLSTNPASGVVNDYVTSRMISCYTIEDPHYVIRKSMDDSFDDRGQAADLSLCVFVWEASTEAGSQKKTYLAVFDINRWYHAQMPHAVRSNTTHEVCPFFAFCSLDAVLESSGPDSIMSVHVDHKSVVKFLSCMVPPPEQHFYPSSLSFDVSCVLSSGVVQAKYLGLQRLVLLELARRGPAAIIEPDELFNLCLCTGLLPRGIDAVSGGIVAQKRSSLLSAALENNHVNFILKCIEAWGSGKFSGLGCTLKTVLDWGWGRVGQIKDNVDRLCMPLYDWSGIPLDMQTRQTLHSYLTCLGHITNIFQALAGQDIPTTEQGQLELDVKLGVVTLIHQHLQVVLWFLSSGLLPEKSDCDFTLGKGMSYPSKALRDLYDQRRKEVANLHSVIEPDDFMMIDSITRDVGEGLYMLWQKEGGVGNYPPPSLHALMITYLLEGAPVQNKHLVTMYLMKDLVLQLPQNAQQQFTEKASEFSGMFGLGPVTGRLAEGFWLLDHREFKQALLVLLDPLLSKHITSWQHQKIIKAFLYQGQHQLALGYLRVRNPPVTRPEHVKLKLTVLLANGLTSEALAYQRSCRDQISIDDLLSHVFLACQQTHTIDKLLQLPMTDEEQSHLVS